MLSKDAQKIKISFKFTCIYQFSREKYADRTAHISYAVCINDIDCLFEESEGSYMNNWLINTPISCLICTDIFYRCCINVQDSPHQFMRRLNMDIQYMCVFGCLLPQEKKNKNDTREEFTNNIIFISSLHSQEYSFCFTD